MSLNEQRLSQDMELFKTQLKIATEIFYKMPSYEQIKALDLLKEFFHDVQYTLNHNVRNNQSKINTGISLTEQSLICNNVSSELLNSLVENQSDELLQWNSSNLICEKSDGQRSECFSPSSPMVVEPSHDSRHQNDQNAGHIVIESQQKLIRVGDESLGVISPMMIPKQIDFFASLQSDQLQHPNGSNDVMLAVDEKGNRQLNKENCDSCSDDGTHEEVVGNKEENTLEATCCQNYQNVDSPIFKSAMDNIEQTEEAKIDSGIQHNSVERDTFCNGATSSSSLTSVSKTKHSLPRKSTGRVICTATRTSKRLADKKELIEPKMTSNNTNTQVLPVPEAEGNQELMKTHEEVKDGPSDLTDNPLSSNDTGKKVGEEVGGDVSNEDKRSNKQSHSSSRKRSRVRSGSAGVPMYVCRLCGEEFSRGKIYRLHLAQHNEGEDRWCEQCGEQFTEAEKITQHTCSNDKGNRNAPQRRQDFSCDQCNVTFTHPQHFEKHMSGHSRNNCKICGAQFAKRKVLCRHLRTAHRIIEAEKFYHCPHCDRKFIKRPSLYVHLKEHAGGKIVCMKCGLMSESEESHSRHMLKHTQEAKFHCEKCNESFLRRQQFEQHMTGHYKYDCTLCDINFSTKKRLLKHKRLVHGIQTREEKKHSCFICQKRFQRPMLLEIHMRLHTGEKPIQCTLCDKNFRTPKALAKHMKTAAHLKACGRGVEEQVELACESEKPYLCAQCPTKFYRRQGLVRHMQQLHSEERPYTCVHCDYSCKCKTNLKRHMELHTDDRRFICELCGASFHARATLKEHHAYVHSEDRNFICSSCGKGFKGRSGLRRHMRIHSDDRPYVCYCGQSYKRMSHLKRHMISIHGALFKSKRVTRISADENSQSSNNSLNEESTRDPEQSSASGEKDQSVSGVRENNTDDGLILTVQHAMVEMLQDISPTSGLGGRGGSNNLQVPHIIPIQQFLPVSTLSQDLIDMSDSQCTFNNINGGCPTQPALPALGSLDIVPTVHPQTTSPPGSNDGSLTRIQDGSDQTFTQLSSPQAHPLAQIFSPESIDPNHHHRVFSGLVRSAHQQQQLILDPVDYAIPSSSSPNSLQAPSNQFTFAMSLSQSALTLSSVHSMPSFAAMDNSCLQVPQQLYHHHPTGTSVCTPFLLNNLESNAQLVQNPNPLSVKAETAMNSSVISPSNQASVPSVFARSPT